MTLSFRARVLGISAAVVAGVLAAVLALTWSRVQAVEIERLEARLCQEARRLADLRPDGGPADRLEADVLGKLRIGSPRQLMMLREPAGDGPALRSAHWDPAIGLDALSWSPAREAGTAPPSSAGPRDRPPRQSCSIAAFASGGSGWSVARVEAGSGRGFVAARREAATDELRDALKEALAVVTLFSAALVAAGAWLLSTLVMKPVSRLREAMKSVDRNALDRRLPARGEDREFAELIGAYNTMLDRLEASFEQASRFSADAAHELKTPLTILQGRLEQAVGRSDNRAIQADLADMLEEVGRLSAITRKLLLLSQADAGRLALHEAPVDFTELLSAVASDAQMLAADQKVRCDVEPGMVLKGDAVLLRQLLNNLVSNAVRYCPSGGWIEITGGRVGTDLEAVFANASPVISGEDRARLFDRFYRRDPARGRQTEGSGLGLGIAREIALAHGGSLSLEPSEADVVRLRLLLPAG